MDQTTIASPFHETMQKLVRDLQLCATLFGTLTVNVYTECMSRMTAEMENLKTVEGNEMYIDEWVELVKFMATIRFSYQTASTQNGHIDQYTDQQLIAFEQLTEMLPGDAKKLYDEEYSKKVLLHVTSNVIQIVIDIKVSIDQKSSQNMVHTIENLIMKTLQAELQTIEQCKIIFKNMQENDYHMRTLACLLSKIFHVVETIGLTKFEISKLQGIFNLLFKKQELTKLKIGMNDSLRVRRYITRLESMEDIDIGEFKLTLGEATSDLKNIYHTELPRLLRKYNYKMENGKITKEEREENKRKIQTIFNTLNAPEAFKYLKMIDADTDTDKSYLVILKKLHQNLAPVYINGQIEKTNYKINILNLHIIVGMLADDTDSHSPQMNISRIGKRFVQSQLFKDMQTVALEFKMEAYDDIKNKGSVCEIFDSLEKMKEKLKDKTHVPMVVKRRICIPTSAGKFFDEGLKKIILTLPNECKIYDFREWGMFSDVVFINMRDLLKKIFAYFERSLQLNSVFNILFNICEIVKSMPIDMTYEDVDGEVYGQTCSSEIWKKSQLFKKLSCYPGEKCLDVIIPIDKVEKATSSPKNGQQFKTDNHKMDVLYKVFKLLDRIDTKLCHQTDKTDHKRRLMNSCFLCRYHSFKLQYDTREKLFEIEAAKGTQPINQDSTEKVVHTPLTLPTIEKKPKR